MVILLVDKFMLLLIWSLDSNVSAISASNDTWDSSHGVELLLWVIGLLVSVTLVMVWHAVDKATPINSPTTF